LPSDTPIRFGGGPPGSGPASRLRPAVSARNAPLGVFDSGLGGLTVARALRERLPAESIVYLGDTARVPYGTRSADTVIKYALGCARILIDRGVHPLPAEALVLGYTLPANFLLSKFVIFRPLVRRES